MGALRTCTRKLRTAEIDPTRTRPGLTRCRQKRWACSVSPRPNSGHEGLQARRKVLQNELHVATRACVETFQYGGASMMGAVCIPPCIAPMIPAIETAYQVAYESPRIHLHASG